MIANKIYVSLAIFASIALTGCDRMPFNDSSKTNSAGGENLEARLLIENGSLKRQVEELTRLAASCSSAGTGAGANLRSSPTSESGAGSVGSNADDSPSAPIADGRNVAVDKNSALNEHDFDSCISAREVCNARGCYTPQPDLNYCNKKYLQGQMGQ